MCLHDCLSGCFPVSVPVCVCSPSHSCFFVFFLSLCLRLTGCMSGHQAFPPLIPPLLFLLCCSALLFPLTSTSLPSSSSLFLPPYNHPPPPTPIVCSHIKTVSIECHREHTVKKKGRDLGNFRRRQLLLWRHNFWICWAERGMNRGIEGGRKNV